MAFKLSTVARNAACNAVVGLLNTGYIRIYDGAQPTNPQTAIGAQVLLAELRFGATAYGAASTGVATANAITGDASANATGAAAWARILQSDGITVSHDATVGTSGTDIVLNTTSVVSGVAVDITAMTFTIPE